MSKDKDKDKDKEKDKEPSPTGGFLSKVARFVRSPTVNWSDIDRESEQESSRYSKQMLKDMIERRRQNDFVRKREFDMLRKLRKRDAAAAASTAAGGRPSFFQDSSQSRPDDRAQTLKKIDEIEAQMSQQWWRTKTSDFSGPNTDFRASQPGRLPTAARRPEATPGAEAVSARAPQPSPPPPAVAPPASPSGFLATQAQSDKPPPVVSAPMSFGFDELDDAVHDPEVEEAAIRFANGDDEGAAACLLDALGPGGGRANQASLWLALFDLYRATGNHDGFESVALDYANRFNMSAPAWFSLPELAGAAVSNAASAAQAAQAGPTAASGAHWQSPATLRLQSLGMLTGVLAKAAQPWRIDWRNLTKIEDAVYEPLLRMFSAWASQAVELSFIGAANFDQVLKDATPSGDRSVPDIRWRLRMEALRVMHQPDEFEMAALDYCVTYEVSPPSWETARCKFRVQAPDAEGGFQTVIAEDSGHSDPALSIVDSGTSSQQHGALAGLGGDAGRALELVGQIMGDAEPALKALDARMEGMPPGQGVRIGCSRLVRVDFGAAGSLLNWVLAREAEGRSVQFTDLHRMITGFFRVIGIHEHARLISRSN